MLVIVLQAVMKTFWFLIFEFNDDENSPAVRLIVLKMMEDIKFLKSKVFTVNANDNDHLVEFKLALLPNDMKMMWFLAGKLSIAATYFTTYADVDKYHSVNHRIKFSMDGSKYFKLWSSSDL